MRRRSLVCRTRPTLPQQHEQKRAMHGRIVINGSWHYGFIFSCMAYIHTSHRWSFRKANKTQIYRSKNSRCVLPRGILFGCIHRTTATAFLAYRVADRNPRNPVPEAIVWKTHHNTPELHQISHDVDNGFVGGNVMNGAGGCAEIQDMVKRFLVPRIIHNPEKICLDSATDFVGLPLFVHWHVALYILLKPSIIRGAPMRWMASQSAVFLVQAVHFEGIRSHLIATSTWYQSIGTGIYFQIINYEAKVIRPRPHPMQNTEVGVRDSMQSKANVFVERSCGHVTVGSVFYRAGLHDFAARGLDGTTFWQISILLGTSRLVRGITSSTQITE